MNQPLSPKDERIVSTNPSVDVAITGPSRTVADQLGSSDVADSNQVHLLNSNASLEQTYYYGGYDSSNSGWSGYSQFSGAEGLHIVPPVIYGDNPSLGLHSPYSFNSQMAYGQYSPASIMVDNLLYSPQQIPASPYYPQPGASTMPHISAAIPVSHAELVAPRGNLSSNSAHSPGFYNVPMMFGSGEPLPSQSNASDMGWRTMSTMTSNAAYTPPIGTFGSYDPNVGQISQQRPFPGSGLVSDPVGGPYSYDDSFSSNYGMMPRSRPPNYRSWVNVEKGRSHREQDSAFVMSGDRNRGPRASKAKARTNSGNTALPVSVSTAEDSSLITAVVNASARGVNFTSFNSADFPTIYEKAKFFIIKSFSEDNVHRSIKYSVWASTPQGNRKLDAAYQEAKGKGDCPVFLFFSVNASAQFCGIAEMMGPVDFEKNADYWQQDRWSGQFPVRWHIVKDVPNSKFRHILLENNDNKPVTHSRDSQEVKLDQGIEMLKIFKNHDAQTSILDDFYYYDERERVLQERKTRQQQAKPKREASNSLNDELKNDISDRLDQALRLEETRTDISPRDKMGDPHQT